VIEGEAEEGDRPSVKIVLPFIKSVSPMAQSSVFNSVLDSIEALPPEDREALIALVQKRLVETRRAEIAANIVQAKADYQAGQVFRGTIDDIIAELEN
jgi:hypothetical protein